MNEAVEFLRRLGWGYLGEGCYKTVYHKRGVDFVVKLMADDETYNCRSIDEEMGDTPCGVPPIDCGVSSKYLVWGLQEKVKTIPRGIRERNECYITRSVRNKVKRFLRGSLSDDNHLGNWGINKFGGLVKID